MLEAVGEERVAASRAPAQAIVGVFPKQANLFAFAVLKGDLQPWMRTESEPDEDEIRAVYAAEARGRRR